MQRATAVRQPPERLRSRVLLALALALVAHAAWSTRFWDDTERAIAGDDRTYAERRDFYSFAGMPAGALRTRLDGALSVKTPIAFGPTVEADGLLLQRLTEALYPRRIEPTAPVSLELEAHEEAGARVLARWEGHGVFVLRGAPGREAAAVAQPPPPLALPWVQLVVGLSSALGFGALASRALRLAAPGVFAPALWLLAAAFLFALTNTVATWAQVPVSTPALRGLGLALAVGQALLSLRAGRAASRNWTAALLPNERWFPIALIGALCLQVLHFPIAMWDGRSIWLFRAQQLAARGMFALGDALEARTSWSHPEYPLLWPSWLAFFGAGEAFHERAAAAGIPVLLAAALALVWGLGRQGLGRWPGAALTLVTFLSVQALSAGGYADGLLAVLLVAAFLGWTSASSASVGWLAAGAAALLKQEGLLLALAAVAFAFPWSRPRLWPGVLALVPAAAHVGWARWHGLRGDFASLELTPNLSELAERARVVFLSMRAAGELPQAEPLLVEGAAGLLVALVAGLWLRRRAPPQARAALGVAAGLWAIIFVIFLVTPQNVRWHLDQALARLLLHPALFGVVAALSMLCTPAPVSASVGPAGR